MTRRFLLTLFIVLGLLFCGQPVVHASLLVSTGNQYLGYGYGNFDWDNMTAAMNEVCTNIDTTTNFENLEQMLTYDALWLDIRPSDSFLSDEELSNLTTFINTGRKVVLMGENNNWTSWNNQILSLVGESYSDQYTGYASPVISNALTEGVSSVYLVACGLANGGTALFDSNFATLWGDNVLTVLNVNVFDDNYWDSKNNGIFAQNVASWVCTPVPLPSTLLLLGSGLLCLANYRRR
jgi:hypothetical protein